METICKIRYTCQRDGKPIRQIVCEFHLSRNTVKKVLRGDVTASVRERRTAICILSLGDDTGTGKTHPAIAIGRQVIKNGKRGCYFNIVDLVNQLEQEKPAGRGGKPGNDECTV